MKRAEIEQVVEPIIRKCLREFGDFTPQGISEAEFTRYVESEATLRPDVRRVSLIISLAKSVLGEAANGEGLEVGSGYGYLLFPMASLLPNVRWSAIDHPERAYASRDDYLQAYRDYHCQFVCGDIIREALPFRDGQFTVVTFSEVLEHLPTERVHFVLSEIARVVRPGGFLIASSPNQASLENRLRLLKGKSILEMPEENAFAKGTYGHIRLYTHNEMEAAMCKLGFCVERCDFESNDSSYRGTSARSWRRQAYRWYEWLEGKVGMLRGMGDTWYVTFRKRGSEQRSANSEHRSEQ